jgi:hypothetical protein
VFVGHLVSANFVLQILIFFTKEQTFGAPAPWSPENSNMFKNSEKVLGSRQCHILLVCNSPERNLLYLGQSPKKMHFVLKMYTIIKDNIGYVLIFILRFPIISDLKTLKLQKRKKIYKLFGAQAPFRVFPHF